MGSEVNANSGWITSVWKNRCSTGPVHGTSTGAVVVVAGAVVGVAEVSGVPDGPAAPDPAVELQAPASTASTTSTATRSSRVARVVRAVRRDRRVTGRG